MKRKKNSLFLTIIILATVLVIMIFGTPIYQSYHQETKKEDELLQDLKDIEEKLAESLHTQQVVKNLGDNDLTKYYETMSKNEKQKDKFREDSVLKFLYDSVETMKENLTADFSPTRKQSKHNTWEKHDFIENIAFTEAVRNEYGFREGKANVTFVFSDEVELMEYINILVNTTEYQIFIHELSYPEF